MLYCLILGASYGGNLRAFLTTPGFLDPLDSLAEVVESDLRIDFAIYGHAQEAFIESSQDPVYKRLWEKKNAVSGGNKVQ